MKNTYFLLFAFCLYGCSTESLVDYQPVIDTHNTDMSTYNIDLDQCVNLALRVEADYKKRQEEQMLSNMMAGIIAGALVGGVAGSYDGDAGSGAAAGAAYGAALGAASETDYERDFIKFGPRRVVDRCMANRGYNILNDVGRG